MNMSKTLAHVTHEQYGMIYCRVVMENGTPLLRWFDMYDDTQISKDERIIQYGESIKIEGTNVIYIETRRNK